MTLLRWLVVFGVTTILASALFILFPVDERAFRAALTQPMMVITKRGDEVIPVGCNCAPTLRHDEIPDHLAQALIATEDKRFHRHFGVDPLSLGRAILSGGETGGSTLAMQLSKNTITGGAPSLFRKYAEAFFATRVGWTHSREDILRIYLSRVNFGRVNGVAVFGLRDAAWAWFGVPPERLSLGQSAILVGMVNAPSHYNPLLRPEAVAARAGLVLSRMRSEGYLEEARPVDIAAAMPGRVHRMPRRDRYLEDQIMRELGAIADTLPDGLHFALTTIDPIAQVQARRVLVSEAKKDLNRGLARAALVTLDGKGRMLAMVGGMNYRRSTWNHAVQARRQAASTAKIATYLAALEAGYGAESPLPDRRAAITGKFRPRNSDHRYLGDIPLAQCLAQSRNVCTYWLAQQVGFEAVAEMAHRVGLTEDIEPGASVVLGASETSLTALSASYAAIAHGGLHHAPYVLRGVLGRNGDMLYRRWPRPERVVASEVADEMKTLLAGVTAPGGTAPAARFRGSLAHGKTGTSQENRDAWFVGFADHGITTGIWAGPDEGRRMRGVAGGDMPARAFARYNVNLVERFRAYAEGRRPEADSYWRDVNKP